MLQNEQQVFEALNDRLAAHNLTLEVLCVGGFVLSHNGMRATQDIDGFFKDSALVKSIIESVGNDFNINNVDDVWLNNSVQNMNKRPDKKICSLLYDFSNLKVYLAPLDYIAGMKLESCREQDILDVASIIKKLSIKEPATLKAQLQKYGFEKFDESLILETFGRAYGMDWLERYYREHEAEILASL